MNIRLKNILEKQNKDFLSLLERLKLCPTYSRLCLQKGIHLEDINDIKNIQRLPIIDKSYFSMTNSSDWPENVNKKIVRIHATSGTTATPIYVPYTQKDLVDWSNIMARTLTLMEVRCSDKVFNALPYGMFTGGLGFHNGAEKIGCTVIPAGASSTTKHMEMMEHLNPSVIIATPSYALHLFESYWQKTNKKPGFRLGIFGGECWTEEAKQLFEQFYSVTAYNCYGLTEMIGPGVAIETAKTQGKLVIQENYFFPEIINPITMEPVTVGEWGELVLTHLSKEASPLMRYRTHDITRFTGDRYHGFRLIDKIQGRTDDLLIVRGVKFYPMQLEAILLTFNEMSSHYLIELERPHNLDELTIKCELKQEKDYLDQDLITSLIESLQTKIKNCLGVSVKITIAKKDSLPQTPGKAKRVRDGRISLGTHLT